MKKIIVAAVLALSAAAFAEGEAKPVDAKAAPAPAAKKSEKKADEKKPVEGEKTPAPEKAQIGRAHV